MTLRLARATDAAFRHEPSGRYVAGEAWLYYCVDPSLFGFVLWEAPSAEDIASLVRLLEAELARAPHAAFVDVRELQVVAAPAFLELAGYFARHAEALRHSVTRAAIARSDGLSGAIAAGFLATVPPTFTAAIFTEPAAALASLGFAHAADVAAAIDAACEEVRGRPAIVREIERWLEDHLVDATLDRAARALAIAPRTLQRRLTEARTSFVRELGAARARVGRRRLATSDEPLTIVALEVGCATPQHFSTLFRKHFGETPTDFRARVRGRAS